jgi:Flp pilus assembly protein TadG
MIAPLFLAVIFAIAQSTLVYFAGQVLETGTRDSARLVLTHQAQDSSMNAQAFKTDLCNRVSFLLNCAGIYIDVESYPAGTAITPYTPVDTHGNFNPASAQYTPPSANSSSIVLVRTFYQWPLYLTGLSGINLTNLGTNTRLLTATAAFRVEPGS